MKRWVIKIGSSLLTGDERGLNTSFITGLSEQIHGLRERGVQVVLVSSGAVGCGIARLGLSERPRSLPQLQAVAAIGQLALAQAYEKILAAYTICPAQVLLTRSDSDDRERYLNARNTLNTLIGWDVLPIVNENDAVANDELRFGDNDQLAAMVTDLVSADALILLTDRDGLYTADPAQHPDARFIDRISIDDNRLPGYATPGISTLGRGGMQTKIEAARQLGHAGIPMIIANGASANVLIQLLMNPEQQRHTLIEPGKQRLRARKRWIASRPQPKGSLQLDAGAAERLGQRGTSLLAVGVERVEGHFQRGDTVNCTLADGTLIARGLVNHNAEQVAQLIGRTSDEIRDLLPTGADTELIHCDNLILEEVDYKPCITPQ